MKQNNKLVLGVAIIFFALIILSAMWPKSPGATDIYIPDTDYYVGATHWYDTNGYSFGVNTSDGFTLYTRDECTLYISGGELYRTSVSTGCKKTDDTNYIYELKRRGLYEPAPTPYIYKPTPTPYVHQDPYPIEPIKTITPTPKPESNSDKFLAFVRDAQERWVYEYDIPGELVQTPQVSYERMSGDCDDFATMIAGYAEAYGIGSQMVIISKKEGLHMVTFVKANRDFAQDMANECNTNDYPELTVNGELYIPLDWTVCPGWKWANPDGKITTYYWKNIVGKPY